MTRRPAQSLTVQAYFDGERVVGGGPWAILHDGATILGIERAEGRPQGAAAAAFAMPSLVDAHVHLFLDGAELDAGRRKAAMAAEDGAVLDIARANAERAWQAGITVLRDAGDPRGINHAIREELAAARHPVTLRSPGPALHRPGRYGSFLGRAVAHDGDIAAIIDDLCGHVDDIKVLLTGVIDFASGQVKGQPQFDEAAARAMVAAARRHGRPAFAHCNGPEGLRVAVRAGFDSIEHGYLMDEDSLRAMAGEGIAWTPTLAPVAAQRRLDPAVSGFGPDILAVLDGILARHAESIARAAQLGVPLYCGSDAGGQGVPHGGGLIDEMLLLAGAGAPVEIILAGATSLPRRRWNEPVADIVPGGVPDLIALSADPVAEPVTLRTATPTSMAVLNLIERAEMPYLSLGGGVGIVEPVRKWTFKIPPTDKAAAERVLEELTARGITKLGMLSENVGYGKSGHDFTVALAPRYGVEIVVDEVYSPKDPDTTPQLTKIRSNPAVQAIFVFGSGNGPVIITKNIKQMGITLPVYQSLGVGSREFLRLVGTAADGMRLPSGALLVADQLAANDPQRPVVTTFKKMFEERTRQDISTLAGHGWDSLMMAVEAIKRAGGTDKAKVRDELEKTRGFVANAGIFNMSPTDHNGLGREAYHMIEVRNGDWVISNDKSPSR